jgi:phosphatidylserine/phosphatidylglycerophosphate/cardiolipin synthase-like enzyme
VTVLRRTIRSNPRAGVRVNDLLSSVFIAELLDPSPHLWLVSPWVSDIPVLDNRDDRLGGLLGENFVRLIHLAEMLSLLATAGSHLHVAIRPDDHNDHFIDRIGRAAEGQVALHYGADLHEKTLCGSDWVVTGSMNFTWRGIEVNDEAVTYSVDPAFAAQTRVDLEHRWPST